MTKLYCARIECKYNDGKDCRCLAKTVNLAAWYGHTVNEGYQEFSRCRTFEESEDYKRVKTILSELKGETE